MSEEPLTECPECRGECTGWLVVVPVLFLKAPTVLEESSGVVNAPWSNGENLLRARRALRETSLRH
ncbi:MAG: hypothetical protein RBS57_04820 [Desulforhabdus sp.]|jgi:hypothetical protein|nr:hypothetical protein [Desulforhabdus sp.]